MNNIAELVRKAAGGNSQAFDELYILTRSGVWFTCISLLKNEANAKDIMQDTYLAAYSRLSSLNDCGAFQSWVNKIAANKCRDFLKSKAVTAVEYVEPENLEMLEDENFLPDDYAADKEKRRIIMDIVRHSLSDVQYQTIILYYFDEMTAAEIAGIMDCSESTVLYRLGAARAKIKEGVMQYEKENNDRLYAIVPIPFLTRLFRAESDTLSVPSMPLDINGVSAAVNAPEISENAAQAVKTGGKTMFNTLKSKIIVAAVAAAVVGGGITAAVLFSTNNSTDSKPQSTQQESESKESSEEPSSDDTAPTSKYHFLVEEVEPSGKVYPSLNGNLFAKDITVPVNLPEASKNWGELHFYPNGVKCEKYNSFEEVLKDDRPTKAVQFDQGWSYLTKFHVLSGKDETVFKAENYLSQVVFPNFSDKEMTASEMYEKNWWYIESNEYTAPELALQLGTDAVYDDNTANAEFYRDMIKQLGQPSRIIPVYGSLEYGDGKSMSSYYLLVYEYEDYVLEIFVCEMILEKVELHTTKIAGLKYYPRECWDEYCRNDETFLTGE